MDYSTAGVAGGLIAGIMMFIVVIIIISLVIETLKLIGTWKMLTKAGESGWKSLIPFFEAENIEFVKVKGHAGNKYNEIVDKMAVSAKEEID